MPVNARKAILVVFGIAALLNECFALSGVNCFGKDVFFQPDKHQYFPDNPPLYMNGNPNNAHMYASVSMPVNLTVAFIGDQGTKDTSGAVLDMLLQEGVEAIVHMGDFDYIDNPTRWDEFLDEHLPPNFPYFAAIGNHDCFSWGGEKGYQTKIYNRLKRAGLADNCIGEVGLNLVCTYKGLTIVLSSYGAVQPSCVHSCNDCPSAGGHAAFIEKAFRSFPGMWRICAWHKNHVLMQVGEKPIEVGLPIYDTCLKFGAIIATAHEHNYCRSHAMSSFSDLVIAHKNNTIELFEGQTFSFVSGLGGWSIDPFAWGLEKNPWWASAHASDNGVTYGGVICKFNLNGELNKAYCYTKLIDNRIIDEFMLESKFSDPDAAPSCVPKESEFQVSRAEADMMEDLSNNQPQCATGDVMLTMSPAYLVGLRFTNVVFNTSEPLSGVYIEWTAGADSAENDSVEITFYGELKASPPYLDCYLPFNLSSRVRTNTSVTWSVPTWGKGGIYRSPDLSPILQEIISETGWKSGNSLVFLITTAGGSRTAFAYEGDRCGSATLVIRTGDQKSCLTFTKPPPLPPSVPTAPPSSNPEPEADHPNTLSSLIALIVLAVVIFIALVVVIIGLIAQYCNRTKHYEEGKPLMV